MELILEGLGKKYIREWIFRHLTFNFKTGEPVAVIGPNGSGKSTLLKILSGYTIPSEGFINLHHEKAVINPDHVYAHIDFVAPYTELIEELTLAEFLDFHGSFKSLKSMSTAQLIKKLSFEGHKHKYIRYFSSGMKQRLKLGLGFFSTSPILFLDEPTSNLDENTKDWYYAEIRNVLIKKMVILASNQPDEYTFVKKLLNINDFKT